MVKIYWKENSWAQRKFDQIANAIKYLKSKPTTLKKDAKEINGTTSTLLIWTWMIKILKSINRKKTNSKFKISKSGSKWLNRQLKSIVSNLSKAWLASTEVVKSIKLAKLRQVQIQMMSFFNLMIRVSKNSQQAYLPIQIRRRRIWLRKSKTL